MTLPPHSMRQGCSIKPRALRCGQLKWLVCFGNRLSLPWSSSACTWASKIRTLVFILAELTCRAISTAPADLLPNLARPSLPPKKNLIFLSCTFCPVLRIFTSSSNSSAFEAASQAQRNWPHPGLTFYNFSVEPSHVPVYTQ